jgi:hypothetical protein
MNIDNNGKLFCYVHPNRETHLRCNKCERPICTSCAVLTPTGYRCKECVRGQQKIFDTARWWDYPLGAVVAFALSMIASVLVRYVGFFALILSYFVGIGVAEAVRFVLRKRRSRRMPLVVAIAAFVGSLLLNLSTVMLVFALTGQVTFSSLFSLLYPLAYAVIISVAAYYRLKGTL